MTALIPPIPGSRNWLAAALPLVQWWLPGTKVPVVAVWAAVFILPRAWGCIFPFCCDRDAGMVAMEMIIRITKILDEAYPELKRAVYL